MAYSRLSSICGHKISNGSFPHQKCGQFNEWLPGYECAAISPVSYFDNSILYDIDIHTLFSHLNYMSYSIPSLSLTHILSFSPPHCSCCVMHWCEAVTFYSVEPPIKTYETSAINTLCFESAVFVLVFYTGFKRRISQLPVLLIYHHPVWPPN
jgi:hypothetical protein